MMRTGWPTEYEPRPERRYIDCPDCGTPVEKRTLGNKPSLCSDCYRKHLKQHVERQKANMRNRTKAIAAEMLRLAPCLPDIDAAVDDIRQQIETLGVTRRKLLERRKKLRREATANVDNHLTNTRNRGMDGTTP